VTGGSGFVGTNAVELYLRVGVPVLNLDVAPPRNAAHVSVWRRADLLDRDAVGAVVREFQPSHVLHLGARTDLDGITGDEYAANVAGTENLIAAVNGAASVERVVFASSRMVCRIGYVPTAEDDYCPTTVYGESKVACERLVRSAEIGPSWVMVRPTSIWGPWFDVPYRDFFTAVERGRYVHPRGRTVRKSFGFVGNSVHQLDRLLTAPADAIAGRTLYLADYVPLDMESWANEVAGAFGRRRIPAVPYPVLRVAAELGELAERTGRRAPLTRFRLANLLTEMVYDLEPLRAVVPDLPYTRSEGIRETIAWLRGPAAAA